MDTIENDAYGNVFNYINDIIKLIEWPKMTVFSYFHIQFGFSIRNVPVMKSMGTIWKLCTLM
jgi:hypothetical protein